MHPLRLFQINITEDLLSQLGCAISKRRITIFLFIELDVTPAKVRKTKKQKNKKTKKKQKKKKHNSP